MSWSLLAVVCLLCVGSAVFGAYVALYARTQLPRAARRHAPEQPMPSVAQQPVSLSTLALNIIGNSRQLDLFTAAADWLIEALRVRAVIIYPLNAATNYLSSPVAVGVQPTIMPERIRLGSTIFGDVARTGMPQFVENLHLDPRFPVSIAGMRSAYVVPLVHSDVEARSLLGALAVFSERDHGLAEPIRRMVDQAATLIAATYSLTHRMGEATEIIERFERFQRMANRLSNHLEFGTLLKEIVDAAVEMLDVDVGILLNVDVEERVLYPVAWSGLEADAVQLIRVRLKEDIQGLVAWARQPARSPNIVTDQRSTLASYAALAGMMSELVAPILYQEQLVGILTVQTKLNRHFTDEEMNLLMALASHAAIAMRNARLFDDLQTKQRQLEKAVADLVITQGQAENAWLAAMEANKLKTEFINNMSHELRTPLNAVINFTRIVTEGHAGAVTDQQKQFLGYVHDSGQYLLGLINDILDLAKIEAGKMELRREMTPLEPILRGVMSTAIGLTREKNLKLHLTLDPDLPPLHIDGQRIRQVLLNLLSNAAKFTAQGSITVSATRRAQDIAITVQDTGIGIKPDDLDKIFEEFRQVDGSLARTETGTGLGMPISRRFVELHGGRMWVDSTYGEGTTVHFTLPLRQPISEPVSVE
ncbi:MAG: GAF domain-containing protein [Anaerolineae bacterium]|nr:GAF domain-containing protein [Anaerolineae bacterium]